MCDKLYARRGVRFNKDMADCDMPEAYGNLFRQPAASNHASRMGILLAVAAMIPLAVTAVFLIRDIADPVRLTISLVLIAAFAGLFLFFIFGAGARGMHYALVAQTVVIALLSIVPGPRDGFLFIVFAILSAQLGMTLRPRVAVVWFLVLAAITLVSNVLVYGVDGWLTTLGNVTGHFFFVLVGGLMREALLARERSDRLAGELRAANEQLQALSLQAQQLAVSEERNRMARELHDSLGHRLTVAVVQLEGAQRLIPSDPERAARMVGTMREQMKEALGDLRRAVAALRAPLEDDLPLGPALARLARSFEDGTGVQVTLTLPDALPDLPPAHRLALFRAAQEALTNAQRHSAAQHVWLDVSVGVSVGVNAGVNAGVSAGVNASESADERADDGSARITITATDDGKGFAEAAAGEGFGLRGLRERATQLGGELSLGRRVEGGAKLIFSLPLGGHGQPQGDVNRPTPATGS